ncbi:MAG: hypothetical protein KDK70_35635 [Myxococcales bacterium]|nr:hypothetical protein [Myxococcales bacterium]
MNRGVAEGLEQAVEVLCRRGIEAGEREAEALVAQAREEASKLRADARAEAERIVDDARRDARAQREQLEHELRQATAAGVLVLRQAVEHAVLGVAIQEALDAALGDEATLGALLVEAVRAFGASDGGEADLEVLLPAPLGERLEAALLASARAVARRGVTLRLDGGVTGGFVLSAEGVELHFTDAAFAEVLRRFLTPRFRRYLGEEAAA